MSRQVESRQWREGSASSTCNTFRECPSEDHRQALAIPKCRLDRKVKRPRRCYRKARRLIDPSANLLHQSYLFSIFLSPCSRGAPSGGVLKAEQTGGMGWRYGPDTSGANRKV